MKARFIHLETTQNIKDLCKEDPICFLENHEITPFAYFPIKNINLLILNSI